MKSYSISSFLLAALFLTEIDAFLTTPANPTRRIATVIFGRKRKPSMAEKRKQRQRKQQHSPAAEVFDQLPKANIDFTDPPDESQPQRFDDPNAAAEKAKEMVQAQRDSVDMLTMVREKIEALPKEKIEADLNEKGFSVIDGFLGSDEIVQTMQDEGTSMYQSGQDMQVDMANLGGGEYIVTVEGGKEQYVKCPRVVELVVSTTKHIPETLSFIALNPSACMANLRTFDRKSYKASLALLTGNEDDTAVSTDAPFASVVPANELDKDGRRLSLVYYPVPASWDGNSGGGLEFESGGEVEAKRDRLVLWRSDTTLFRKRPWLGTDDVPIASCLELHLVSK